MNSLGPTPLPRVTLQLHALCRKLAPDSELLLVPNEPVEGASVNNCFPNVRRIVQDQGGMCEYGWQIWEVFPRMLLEAEFHAVWIDQAGVRHDVTPKPVPIPAIAYLPDPDREYTGRQVDNIRVALSKDPVVTALIKAYRARFRALNRGELADRYGDLDTPEIRAARQRVADLERLVATRTPTG